jgi:radical SAM superfamily enzyme YgiQ (UPF0313 family)
MRSVLISTYEMGRQPFGLASAAAWLRAGGWDVTTVDAAKEKLQERHLVDAELIGFHLPMHTATRLASPIIETARRVNPAARICAFGLYAPLNAEWLRSLGADAVFGGEFEEDLAAWAGDSAKAALKGCATNAPDPSDLPDPRDLRDPRDARDPRARRDLQEPRDGPGGRDPAPALVAQPFRAANSGPLPKIHFLVPDRSGLPPLSKYATLQMPDGARRLVGYTEASRGCRHLCRHCPVVPIYHGQFRVVQPEVVLADVDAQIAAGAQHITFGDPDFFNGPTHAMRIVSALHAAHPDVSYDVTIKIEHLLQHRDLVPRLAETGCAFVTSAVESVDDRVLAIFDKGHTRADFVDAVALCRESGVTLVPTFVAFHPWLSLASYCELLDTIEALDLVDHVSPIQLAIRLLVPEGSRLLELDEMRAHIGVFDAATLTYRWSHPDPRVDALHADVMTLAGTRLTADRRALFDEVSTLAHERAGIPRAARADARPVRARATVPYLNEPWYC